MSTDAKGQRADRLAELIETRLGVRRGRGLEAKLRAAGRRLPKALRVEAARIVEARKLQAHPKLSRQTDAKAVEAAYDRIERWLKTVNPAERRKDLILGFLATNALNMILIFAALVAWAVWTGRI